jgi:acyl-CoA dehydrogenase
VNEVSSTQSDPLQQVQEFARQHIRPNRLELITATEFPADLWQAFASSGLAGLSIPVEQGGSGASYLMLSKAAERLNKYGGVPGVTMVFMSHWLTSKLHIAGDAPDSIKQELLPKLIAGTTTLSVAISEPDAGAHPKHLKTVAERDGDDFVLNGEKAFLTNGPLAGYFIVLAITGETNGQKEFSAVLVPADTLGFSRTEGVKIDFLNPCPHGGIRLENCRVPITNLIGIEGEAFTRTSMRMRAIEDATGAAGHVGAMECLLEDIAVKAELEHAVDIGKITTQLQALRVTAAYLAELADGTDDDVQALLELQLGFRQYSHICCKAFRDAMSEKCPPETQMLYRDISKLHSIAQSAHTARLTKIGQSIMQS